MRPQRYFSFLCLILTVGLTTYVAFRYLTQLSPLLVALLLMAVTSLYVWLVLWRHQSSRSSLNSLTPLNSTSLLRSPSFLSSPSSSRSARASSAQHFSSERLEVLGEAASTIAHEITNPVSYVDSNLSGLVNDLEAYNEFIGALDQASDHLDISAPFYQDMLKAYQTLEIAHVCDNAPKRLRDSIEGIHRIEGIVNDLSALGGSSCRDDMRIADINSELPSVFNLIRSRLPEGVTLSTHLIKVPAFLCHPAKIAQVVFHMLDNALVALDERPGNVSVTQELTGEAIVINITDEGCGMPQEVMKRIFEPFYTTYEKGKGSGIGLALCYILIREHNGDIAVVSREGKGTTFTLTIPVPIATSKPTPMKNGE